LLPVATRRAEGPIPRGKVSELQRTEAERNLDLFEQHWDEDIAIAAFGGLLPDPGRCDAFEVP
jgi:hypothetical protein